MVFAAFYSFERISNVFRRLGGDDRKLLTPTTLQFSITFRELLGKRLRIDYFCVRQGTPTFLQFPNDELLEGRRTLIVDDVWGSGRTSTSVRERVVKSAGQVYTCVLHFNPYRSLFTKAKPDFYGEATDAYIIYPWEIDRGTYGIGQFDPSPEPEVN